MPEPGPDIDPDVDPHAPDPDRLDDGVEHLQAAASEMIAAGRAFLDAVEDLVRDREAVASVVDAFGTIAHAASIQKPIVNRRPPTAIIAKSSGAKSFEKR